MGVLKPDGRYGSKDWRFDLMRYQSWGPNLIYKLVLSLIVTLGLIVPANADVENIDSYQLKNLIREGVALVDVREELEWRETGIISKSHLMTFFDSDGKYDVKKWMGKLKEIVAANEPLIIICRSGRRSLIVAEYLSENESYSKVYNAVSGINGWKSDKLNLERFR
jgi:rhodanese-related sulfurtransferase